MWLPRPHFRIKSSIPVEWHQVWQVVHSSCCSKGASRKVWEKLWCSSCLSHALYWLECINTKSEGCLSHADQTCQVAEDQHYPWYFQGNIELNKYSREEYDSISMAQCQQLYELWKKARLTKVRRPQTETELRGPSGHTWSKTQK